MTSVYMPLDEEIVEHDTGYDPYNSATTRKAPPIPAWLNNDPELYGLAVRLVDRMRRTPQWEIRGSYFDHAAMYRKG